mmetsp:Transcript_46301/g.68293  ORF Transcript_46301/g.68293 Transcript_46301/m.68293 type:complete len:405 (+) Transcript_46301:304-1518(+)|eukprot:CAMPEP_0195516706 /NCGR_PEP_ID=MMETSP0794_2-20130614/8292_1 /TAXON_ID=515487 /ORGANISM="Stephanopyxis turris, Strain CCMP 815" /LENGTH=404 /DNA_ID=CAMNT_0040645365 /DNA_START=279 /DNA_END=1493 /DNA_ORIENTATION=+
MTPPGITSLAVAAASSILFSLDPTRTGIHAASFVQVPSTRKKCELTSTCNYGASSLSMSKDSNRARVEKNFEDMMGDDWRVFRAKLIAQERVDSDSTDSNSNSQNSDDRQDHRTGLGNMVAGAISSIFSSPNQTQHEKGETSSGAAPEMEKGINSNDIESNMLQFEGTTLQCTDPFLSEEELPIMMQPKVQLNKHRWAHPLTHIEPGCVLLANEKLGGVFHQTVVLVIDHHETTGSTGIVINRPLPGNLLKVASETVSNIDLSLKLAFNSAPVAYGGPVMTEDYSILHGYGEVEGSKKVSPGVFVGGSKELMNEVRAKNFHPSESLFVKGHAAWVPGQLSREMSKGVWYVAAASEDFILRYAGAPEDEEDNMDDLWVDILSCMGGDFSEIGRRHSGRGDRRLMP